MKIVVSGYVGKKITGIGRNLISLLNASSGKNHYIVYINKDMQKDFIFSNPHIEVKTYNISKESSLMNLLWTTFVFPFVVVKENADRALIPNFTLLLLKFRPTVVILHDLIEFNVPNKFSKKKMIYRTKLADPITAKRATKIITVSENSKNDIIKFLKIPTEKITVIYNGVDQSKFKKMEKDRARELLHTHNWPDNFILYAGTIDHPGKNPMTVIKAFEILKKENSFKGQLILAGMPGSGYDVVEKYINQSPYKNNIILTGYVSDNELIALYSECKVFCFLSLYEGFGIPPLEALSCGATVITSNCSSLPEVVGEVGITVSPMDETAVAKKIETILTEGLNKCSKDIEEHLKKYNWLNLSQSFEQVFENLEV